MFNPRPTPLKLPVCASFNCSKIKTSVLILGGDADTGIGDGKFNAILLRAILHSNFDTASGGKF